MAELGEPIVCLPTISNSDICRKESVACQLCDEMSSELYKAQQEILSYEKFIQVLREELINMAQHARPVPSSRNELLDDQGRSSKPKDGWYQVPFSSRNMKPTKISSLQTIPHTTNLNFFLTSKKIVIIHPWLTRVNIG